jgi:hypothetical protein
MQLQIGRVEFLRHNLVDQILDPLLGRLEALLLALRRLIVGGGAVHRLGGPLRRHRKGKADDAGEPLVEIVLVLRLLGLHDLRRGLAGHEFCPPALGQVAGEFGVPIILELSSI